MAEKLMTDEAFMMVLNERMKRAMMVGIEIKDEFSREDINV